MLDQEKTGRFIAQMRKEHGLTQRELAERLGISDKTVSKWETGNGMPDVSVMQPLCGELGVNLNELLSGERLSEESYNGKAEENMMNLVRLGARGCRERKLAVMSMLVGLVLLVLMLEVVLLTGYGGQLGANIHFLDIPSLLFLFGIVFAILVASGRMMDFARALGIAFRSDGEDGREDAKSAVKLVLVANLIAGGLITLIGLITVLYNLDEPSSLGPSGAIALLSQFYALTLDAILLPVYLRLEQNAGGVMLKSPDSTESVKKLPQSSPESEDPHNGRAESAAY